MRYTSETKILPEVSVAGLQALANARLAPTDQTRLDELLELNSAGKLADKELQELDAILQQVDELNLLKARAEYTLRQQTETK